MKHFYRSNLLLLLLSLLATCRPAVVLTPEAGMTATAFTDAVVTLQPTLTVPTIPSMETDEEILPDNLDISYTEGNPLTDPEEIFIILDSLAQQHIHWLSRPGWYLNQKTMPDGVLLTGTHFVDNEGNCAEQFEFMQREGQIFPSQVRLSDGTFAQLYNQSGPYDLAETPPVIIFPDADNACSINTVAYDLLTLRSGKQVRLKDYQQDVFEVYELRLWKEILEEQETIALYENAVHSSPLPLMWIRDQGTWVSIWREQHWLCLDPLSGETIGERVASYVENGGLLDGDEEMIWISENLFSLDLPSDLSAAYEEITEALRKYITDLKSIG